MDVLTQNVVKLCLIRIYQNCEKKINLNFLPGEYSMQQIPHRRLVPALPTWQEY